MEKNFQGKYIKEYIESLLLLACPSQIALIFHMVPI